MLKEIIIHAVQLLLELYFLNGASFQDSLCISVWQQFYQSRFCEEICCRNLEGQIQEGIKKSQKIATLHLTNLTLKQP